MRRVLLFPALSLLIACSKQNAGLSEDPVASVHGAEGTPSDRKPPHAPVAASHTPEKPDPNRVKSQEDCPEGMVFVRGGTLSYPWLKDEPIRDGTLADVIRQGKVEAFCIDKREVSADDLDFGLREECPREPLACVGLGGTKPATCVTHARARCYCAESMPSLARRLPTGEEWLLAAVGETGHRFPWGDTWYPWGNSRYEGRPDTGLFGAKFCDRQRDENLHGSRMAYEQADPNFDYFPTEACSRQRASLDISPFGVENMGSSVLEITAVVIETQSGPEETPLFGLDHERDTPADGPPHDESLVASTRGLRISDRWGMTLRALPEVGFRCALSHLPEPSN